MQQNKCPDCEVELEWTGQYHCGQCESDFKKVGFCPDCGAELEKLQACGAENYFCNTCNELKSKSRVRFEFQKIS
ncbi:zinc ribbon domain-containing protein [Vibrio parahaemolyticus]|uniref:zinc ribbon domain-containing protein n=1 Tax=Vibrio parahaemolyticus TaxID=670 RepID=UPI000541F60E|nr:zinc ribbon domain-containing protein [Vibrio parahaemolyticus]EHH1104571.1 DNA ligase [Vibrio parahaemolyticus]EHH1933844.1 DNA ligase [Vibrio parahaemolyticus]EIE1197905.1 zinc ribbon domain-containing protein [Vibrio parahaemolyticus]EIU6756081.1 zinc ribbon domain-containing protein [Vibrio parahaemolyticus]EIZ1042061.1 zinc ribbon domain-containing protein [Vibrio parahaemolyticus]